MAKNLITNILINAKTTDAFNNIAARLLRMGQQINGISSRVMEFEKESVNIYRSYEDNMLAAEFALSAQYKSATKLARVMDGLDIAAREWASTTIFHTDDVSAAINEAAHAGWSYEQILIGIPEAMKIAQAGGLDLSEGLNYLVKILNSTDTEFDKAGTVVDQWAKAANISATNIDELGQALIALGASATFADSTQEIFTLLALLADVGSTGSTAGTLLRNAMMRVVAPTTKAEAAMSLLGADAEELEEVLADESVQKAAKKLEGLGFSAYDAQGNLKPMTTIFTEIWGLIEHLDEASQNEILGGIFPLRSINAAKAFMAAVSSGKMQDFFTEIGDSEGYAASGAEIMMSGLTGAIETLASKWEEFQNSLGETLAPGVESMAGWLGNIVDWLNDLDEPTMSALAGALTAIAAAGPGMLITGAAIMLLSSTPGKILLAAMAIGALAGYLEEIHDMDFQAMFGNVKVNLGPVLEEISGIGTQFDADMKLLQKWEDEVTKAATLYQEKSTEMSELMLTDVLSGKKLTGPEKKNLVAYAESIGGAVVEGLRNSRASTMSFLQLMFGDEEKDAQEYITSTDVVMAYFEESIGQAESLGQQLRDQMVAALADDTLDEAELKAIQATQARMNQIMAEIAALTDSEGYYTQLSKSQRVSFDTIEDFVTGNDAAMNAEIESLNAQFDKKVGVIGAAYDWALKKGLKTFTVDGIERAVTEADRDAAMAEAERERDSRIAEIRKKYMEPIRRARQVVIDQSEFSDAWDFLTGLTYDENGNPILTDAFAGMTGEQLSGLMRQFDWLVNNGNEFKERLKYTDEENAFFMRMMTAAAYAGNAAADWAGELSAGGWDTVPTEAAKSAAEMAPYVAMYMEGLRTGLKQLYEERAGLEDWYTSEHEPYGKTGMAVETHYQSRKEEIEAAIAAYEEELAALEAEHPEIVFEVNDDAVEKFVPEDKYATVFYGPEETGGRTNGGGGGGGQTMMKYAEGGRASMASIFGDAGPEWAIPEEHSERTASLLNAAREASGFTWGDLIGRYGGLNAGNGGVTVNYQPVINGGDGAGIAAALAQDRDALVKLVKNALEEAKYKNAVFAY